MSDNLPLIRETLAGVAEAVADELRAAAAHPNSRHYLHDGRLITRAGSSSLWSWEFDGELVLQTESVGQLLVEGREPVTAAVVAVGDLDVVLSINDELGEATEAAVFVAQPLFILQALQRRLANAVSQLLDTFMLEQVLDLTELLGEEEDEPEEPRPARQDSDEYPPEADASESPSQQLSYEQLMAAEHATQDGLRFVWGPPGTGKTATLAAAVAALAASGRRVLVVAHSNVAVDVAMVRVAEFMSGTALLDDGKVLRVGTAQLAEALACSKILPAEIVARRFPDLGSARHDLEDERRRLSGDLRKAERTEPLLLQLNTVRKQLAAIDRQLEEGQAELIRDARVVGCTLSKVAIDAQLWSWPRDTVIIDEASMAGLPFVMALAAEAPRTLACFGDFRQLPPVAISERAAARSWFGRDVFELAGVVRRVEEGLPDPRLAILRTQYRMGETIAAGVSEVAYFSMLSTDTDAIERAHALAEVEPESGCEVVIVDTSGLHTACQQDAARLSFSRFNLRSAAVATVLAQRLAGAGLTVGAMSPYRAQVALLSSLLRSTASVTTATMHRFQGSERDAVVVDLVDAMPAQGPSRLTGKDANLAMRLLNVGISRAKGKLLIVADVPFLRERSAKDSPVLQFLDAYLDLGARQVPAEHLVAGAIAPSVEWSTDWWTAVDQLVGDGEPAPLLLGLSDSSFAGDTLRARLEAIRMRTSRLRVHVPLEVAARLDGLGFDLRLMPLGPGQFAIYRGRGVVLGGNQPDEPTAMLKGAAVSNAVHRLTDLEA